MDLSLMRDILHHPPNSQLSHDGTNHIIHVPGSAEVALDDALARLWQLADGRSLAELEENTDIEELDLSAQVLALRLAGLLLPPVPEQPRSPAPIPIPPPLVSVVIVSRNGRHHLQECLPSLKAQTYPRLEIVLVNDNSSDDTVTYLQTQFPDVRIVPQSNGPNFAAGCNVGIAQASGDLIFLLNNDTLLDRHCVQELVGAYVQGDRVGGVAAMMRFYQNRPFVNGLGTSIRRLGFGHDLGIGSLDVGQFAALEQAPLLCFGAALIPRPAWEQVGPIEEAFQFYSEDADWSYRARALGFNLIPAARALVYHKFSASTGTLPSSFKIKLATRNRLWLVLKNFRPLAALFQLSLYTLDDTVRFLLHIVRREFGLAQAIVQARTEYLRGLPRMLAKRRQAWWGKRRTAVNLQQLAHAYPLPQMVGSIPALSAKLIEEQYRPFLQRMNTTNGTTRPNLLIISPDSVAENMGGVGIRYWELACQLADTANVMLAVPNKTDLQSEAFAIRHYQIGQSKALKTLASTADIILLSGFTVYHHPFLKEAAAYFVVDLYDPMVLENLERFGKRPLPEQNNLHTLGVQVFNDLFQLGDFFICASEKQRDYWLGALTAANRVNPAIYAADPTLRRLIDVVPFGLPDKPPGHTQNVLKGVWPGIDANDKVILWGGGLWDWLDPLTLIKAMPTVLEAVPEARVFFLGTKHPNPDVPPSRMAEAAIQLADSLALKDKAIFFNDWTPYGERVNYLCEADVGVSLHGDHIETRFAVRTRLMDYFWAGLPMVINGGDTLSNVVEDYQLGHVVAAGDATAVAHSLITILQTSIDPAHFQPIINRFQWSVVAKPLKAYVQAPWSNGENRNSVGKTAVTLTRPATPLFALPQKAFDSLKEKGVRGLWRDIRAYLIWIQQQ